MRVCLERLGLAIRFGCWRLVLYCPAIEGRAEVDDYFWEVSGKSDRGQVKRSGLLMIRRGR